MGSGVLLLVAATLGVVNVRYGSLAVIGGAVVLVIGLVATDIALLPVLAFPAVLLSYRAGPLSVTDLVLIAASVPAFLLYRRDEARELQPLLWLGIAYQTTLVPTLILNPYKSNLVEWGHELFMVIGGLLVGWVVGRRGFSSTALRLYVLGCAVLAIGAFVAGLIMLVRGGSFGPVYLWGFHKNFLGDTIAFAFVILFLNPDWLGWSKRFTYPFLAICAAGIAASGARQAILSVIITLVIMSLRPRMGGGGRGRILLLSFIPAIWFVANSVSDQLEQYAQGDRFNSASQRLVWFRDSLKLWEQSPLFGVGLRWWYTGRFENNFQPPNSIFEMLSSAGIVGTVGFLILCLGGLWVMLTINPRFGNLAVAIMITRFVQGQLDLYWLAGLSSMPWMVAGLVIGALALERSHQTGEANELQQDRRRAAIAPVRPAPRLHTRRGRAAPIGPTVNRARL